MLNPSNLANVNAGLNPVSRIVPVLAMERIAGAGQELNAKINQFVLGQEYSAKVLAKVSETAFQVNVGGTLLKMELGNVAQLGQTLNLRYLQSSPVPTFLLIQPENSFAEPETEISNAAKLIDHLLQQAKTDGVSNRFQASTVMSQHPNNPQVMAQDLKQAVSQTGLFYESHLNEFAQGNRSLASIMQESQNLNGAAISTLVSQQLNVLENQKFSWNGAVWPGQNMALDVYREPDDYVKDEHQSPDSGLNAIEDRPIHSEMTLHLPNLGKVSAKISLVEGRLKINIQAEQQHTLATLNNQRLTLASAIEKNGQQLDTLTVIPLTAARP